MTKMAVYVGWHEAGLGGALAATIGMILPSALLMGVLGALLMRHRDHWAVAAALRGVKPAIVGLLAFVAWDLAPAGIRGALGAAVAVAAFAALAYKVHPAWVMLAATAFGLVAMRQG
jgi:chromate transporter